MKQTTKRKFSEILIWVGILFISSVIISACASKGHSEKTTAKKATSGDTISFSYSEITGIGVDSLYEA